MADLTDVLDSLAGVIAGVIYPQGAGNQSAVGAPCRVYAGWPIADQLERDIQGIDTSGNQTAPTVNISIFPRNDAQDTTRFSTDFQTLMMSTPTLTLEVAGNSVTVGGTVAATPVQNLILLINRKPYAYQPVPTDTLASIAVALAGLVNADTSASSSGPVITIPAAFSITARVGTTGTVLSEVSREMRGFQVSIWPPTPRLRSAVEKIVKPALDSMSRLPLPDGSTAWLRPAGGVLMDSGEKLLVYRRDLFYAIEYPTTITETATQIVAVETALSGGIDPTAPPIATLFD